MLRDGFSDMVKKVWEQPVAGSSPSKGGIKKLRSLLRYLGGWAKHLARQLKKEKLFLSSSIDDLEAIAEVRPLTSQEIEHKSQYNARETQMVPKI
jgi:hypothetical protein